MTDLDRETTAAIDALDYRLQNRGDDDGQYATDNQMFAQEYVLAMRLRGWRPTEARAPWEVRSAPNGTAGEKARQAVEALRAERGWLRAADGTPGDAT